MVALNKEFNNFKKRFKMSLRVIYAETTRGDILRKIEDETIHLTPFFNLSTDNVNMLDAYIGFYLRVLEYIIISGYAERYSDFVKMIVDTIRKATDLGFLIQAKFNAILKEDSQLKHDLQTKEFDEEFLIAQYIADITQKNKIVKYEKITFSDWLAHRVKNDTLGEPTRSSSSSRSHGSSRSSRNPHGGYKSKNSTRKNR